VEQYISSGILELYVAGVIDEEVSIDVIKNVKKYNKIKDEVNKIENTFFSLAVYIAPKISETDKEIHKNNLTKAIQTQRKDTKKEFSDVQNNLIKTIPIWIKLVAAASILFLLASVLLNALQYNRLKAAKQKIIELEDDKKIMLDNFKIEKTSYQQQFATIHEGIKIELSGVESHGGSKAYIYWDQNAQTVIVDAIDLPNPPKGKVYQLWSLTSLDPLTPKDAGLLSNFENNANKYFKTNNVNEALAFAITLEPSGGSKQPTLSELQVMGNLK